MYKTVGEASLDLLQKSHVPMDVVEVQREIQKSLSTELEAVIRNHKAYADKYYIQYILQKERLLPNVLRPRIFVRKTRPSPDYDTSLFSYDNNTCELKFHWTIPDEETCVYLLNHEKDLSDEERELWGYVKKFADVALL